MPRYQHQITRQIITYSELIDEYLITHFDRPYLVKPELDEYVSDNYFDVTGLYRNHRTNEIVTESEIYYRWRQGYIDIDLYRTYGIYLETEWEYLD